MNVKPASWMDDLDPLTSTSLNPIAPITIWILISRHSNLRVGGEVRVCAAWLGLGLG